MFLISIRFYEELNDFLPCDLRKKEYSIKNNDARSVKDLIESQGVPHTEVDLILVNSKSVGFGYNLKEGDRISVYPCFETLDITQVSRLGRPPLRSPHFIADVNLGKLSRNLRLLGLDCYYQNDINDWQVSEISYQEKRIVLTRDRGLLKRKSITHGVFIHSVEAVAQTLELIKRINLENFIKPFTRCLKCNGLLRPVDKCSVHSIVPIRIYNNMDRFFMCNICRKVYWKGSHWSKLTTLIKKIRRKQESY